MWIWLYTCMYVTYRGERWKNLTNYFSWGNCLCRGQQVDFGYAWGDKVVVEKWDLKDGKTI